MRRSIIAIAVLVLSLLPTIGGCQPHRAGNSDDTAVKIEYFYFNACAACQKEKEIAERVNGILSSVKGSTVIDLKLINVFDSGNYDKLLDACKKAHVASPNPNDPYVFVDGKYLSGDDAIQKGLQGLFLEAKDAAEPKATIP